MTYTRTSCSHEGTAFNMVTHFTLSQRRQSRHHYLLADINKWMAIDLIRGVWAVVSMTANDSWGFSLNTDWYCSRPLILGANYQYFFSIKLSWNQTKSTLLDGHRDCALSKGVISWLKFITASQLLSYSYTMLTEKYVPILLFHRILPHTREQTLSWVQQK